MKQTWGIPAFHEVKYTQLIMDMFQSLKLLKTMKEVRESKHGALRFLLANMKDLESYKFFGIKLEHSPVRFKTQIVDGFPQIVRDSQPSSRDIIRFMHIYAEHNLKFIPIILKECTHAWSPLAVLTIDPVTLIECGTGKIAGGNLILDDNAIATIAYSDEPWKELFQRALKEDPRLSNVLGMEYDNGALLRLIRKQLNSCIYEKKMYRGELFLIRWFLEVTNGTGILASKQYKKLRLNSTDVVKELSKICGHFYDMKTHFQLTILRITNKTEKLLNFHVVPDIKVITADMFDPNISIDTLGPRNFLILFMLVNARVMNLETGLESFFSSLKSQNFSGGQHWQTLTKRGAVKIHIGEKVSQMYENMQQLAKLSLHGLPKWHLPKMILPITIHSGLNVPKGIRKFLKKETNMYTRAQKMNFSSN